MNLLAFCLHPAFPFSAKLGPGHGFLLDKRQSWKKGAPREERAEEATAGENWEGKRG